MDNYKRAVSDAKAQGGTIAYGGKVSKILTRGGGVLNVSCDYSPLNLYLVILWILDFKYILLLL